MLVTKNTHKYLIIMFLLLTLSLNIGIVDACFCSHHNTLDEDLILCPEEPENDCYLEGTDEYYNQPGRYLDKPLRLISDDGAHYI